ncbi:MAG TPA: F0F1 ATP synthase subunit A [Candidatus Dormibacteraeota bacterium]|nr:F0F1 ATP synthase subunit A [Candidatus Dormibacteraeota bacterium]
MIAMLNIENPPVTHPAVDVCNVAIICRFNDDTLISSAVSVALTLALAFYVANRLDSRRPGKFQMVFEFVIGYARSLIRETVGEQAMWILPLALTLFFYILIANWIELLPLPHPFTPANTDLNQTLAMALLVVVLAEGYAIKVRGLRGFLHHLTRPHSLPIPMRVYFTFINVVEELAKPVSLSLRLMGNIFGGVIMLWVLTVMLPLIPIPVLPYGLSIVLVGVWKAFDVFLIGTLQAFIFFLLTIIYFGMAVEGVHESEGESHAEATSKPAMSAATSN